ncbi:unnamed protein product [Rotaria socialis]|uniref:Huntingtin interacting protein 1 n=1 Tax=Rotaria socialis TaxID=392032 RepID=A0A817MWP3_9BILA|nr:unnamed protein product [Rotaria socialis]CAF3346975.1 unnamed protein product [Rotaria socialis]CAF3357640.1 unnamed protein product [Rotaria socialis]CAF3473164.1 unnamed protein product [Rotaria socialis]CAF3557300.1 unnamed protein product [Rotaria socialis]
MSVYNRRSSMVNLNQLVTNIPIRRKAADQVERDKFEWSQWQSATKAINNVETPAKEKHVRNLILGTFRLEGGRLFWSMMTRLQLESNPIVCWKFCYVIHRLLRDGHKHVVNDSIPLAPYFEQLGKFWNALRQCYGIMTYRYCRLMISKLTFHERNPTFLGNLSIGEHNDIRRVFTDNLDAYFQLCIELLDYMEELLGLVESVFTSLDQSRANSMTTAGQCRLHPLIICVQDSSLLYDYIVKVLFKLHDSLPGDTLQGHRQRLIDQFRRLKRFYEQASTLQYFKDLIKVPLLPDSPPNFKIKDDIKNYQTPVAIVHTPPPEPAQTHDEVLIDTSDDTRSTLSFAMSDDWPPNGHPVVDRSKEIVELEQRLSKYDAMLQGNRVETDELHRLIAAKDTELITERNHRLQLEEQLRQQLDNQRRMEEMHALDKKSNSDEKYNKLHEAYTKLREEHIIVLRREGEVKKQLANLNQEHLQLKAAHKRIDDEFNQLKTDYEQLKTKQNEETNQEIIQLRQTNDEIFMNMNNIKAERDRFEKEIDDNRIRLHHSDNQRQNLEKTLHDEKERTTTLEHTIETLTRELNEKKQVLQREMTSFENQNKILVEHETRQQELEDTLIQMSKLINESEAKAIINEKKLEEFQLNNKTLETTLQNKTNEFNNIVNNVQHELHDVEQKNKDLLTVIDQLKILNSSHDSKLIETNGIVTELQHKNEQLEKQLEQSNREKEQYQKEMIEFKKLMEKRESELQDRISALTNERNNYQTVTVTTTERIKEIEHAKQSVEDRYKELESQKLMINSQLENQKSDFEKRLNEAETERRDLFDKNREHEESLIDLIHEKEELEHKVLDLEAATREWAQKFVTTTDNQKLMQTNHGNMLNNLKQQYKFSILTFCINQMHDGIERTKDIDLLNCKSGAEYLLSKLRTAVSSTKTTQDLWNKQLSKDESAMLPFLNECISLATCMVDVVVHGKATSNLVQDVDQGVGLADNCREVTLLCIDLYTNYQTPSASIDFDKQSNELIRRLNSLIDKTTILLPKVSDISKEELGDLVEKELQLTHETIDEAVRLLEAMMTKSREQDTGIKCEVNGQILDSCGKLMQTIKVLIIKARDLQKEIVSQGRGTATAREFYTKNHKWTEGLVSAAKNVGVNAKVLIDSADRLLSGNGKFEEIIACSQEIAAATAQLVAASNVKADRESKNREALTHASKAVNTSTAQVVATAKNCASIIEEKSTMDFSSLNLHTTKRKEMDAQVKVLELEKALEQAKQQLYKLRKQHYQMAGEEAGWDQSVITNLDAANNPHN